MRTFEQLRRLDRIHSLICRKATGTPLEFASKLDISRATLFRYLDYLKDYGAPLKYSKLRCSYYYGSEFEFDLQKKLLSLIA